MRIFFALWPPAATASALAGWAREAQRVTGGRVTEEGRIHLTLAFLGEADERRAAQAAARVEAGGHALPLEQAGHWKHNGIVWAGPRQTPPPLQDLFGKLERELFLNEFMLERRPLAAHVTLIRKARAAPLPALPPGLDWPVREFLLVASTLSGKGPDYRPLHRFALRCK